MRRALLCARCAETVEPWQGSDPPIAYGLYGGALSSALLRLKYGSRPDLAQPLGRFLEQAVQAHAGALGPIDWVVPVPVPFRRLVERGYNQAALLARPLVTSLRARFGPVVLARGEEGTKQAALGRRERLENLRGAFRVRDARPVRDQRILLVDDISTTGATIEACTQALLAVGVKSVVSAVVARTPPPGLA